LLTADLVHARRREGRLQLTRLNPKRRARALALATALREVAEAHVGETREALQEAWGAIDVQPREKKLADGLRKLLEDGMTFDSGTDLDPVALRRSVFERATAARKALPEETRFDRGALLDEVAAEREMTPEALEAALYGDLKSAHRLVEIDAPSPERTVERYDLEQARAVLLKATQVRAEITNADPSAARALFRRLKFLRLLHRIEPLSKGSARKASYRLTLDGPMHLIEQSTRYGLSLALALEPLMACGNWRLEADLRWGKDRRPLRFALEGEALAHDAPAPRLPDEVEALRARFAKRKGPWTVEVADELLDLPGVGICVPDLRFLHRDGGDVLLEVLGFWSRDAVWKRVDLARAGLGRPVLFAVSSRLRVSEEVLDDLEDAALLVYKGALSATKVAERLDRLRR
jgi:predicted nuclease of restriction endonuclease-like RecB superfamily